MISSDLNPFVKTFVHICQREAATPPSSSSPPELVVCGFFYEATSNVSEKSIAADRIERVPHHRPTTPSQETDSVFVEDKLTTNFQFSDRT